MHPTSVTHTKHSMAMSTADCCLRYKGITVDIKVDSMVLGICKAKL